jgi:hypothetical protein
MDKTMIITFCNKEYKSVAPHWVMKIKELGQAYIVIASDEDTYEYLKARNIRTNLHPHKGGSFWKYRMEVVYELLCQGNDVIHSDLDAFWEKNLSLDHSSVDMWFSQGTVSPAEHVNRHGFVLCCGLFSVKSNDRTKEFFHTYLENFPEGVEDQAHINRTLIDTDWKKSKEHKSKFKKHYKYFKEDIIGYNSEYSLNLGLISMLKVQREKYADDGHVYHLLSSKTAAAKLEVLQKI